ncbi:MAG: acetate--CoA ligase family protein [Pseudoxanthomonas sp.]
MSNPAQHPLHRLFYPRSIALVGASDRSPWSHMIAGNLKAYGCEAKAYAVNKNATPAHGMEAFASCKDLPEVPDAAFIFVPLEAALEAVEDAGQAGIKAAVILTSGFAETGEEGAQLQQQLVELAQRLGMSILGPNCLGYANVGTRTPMTPIPAILPLLSGKVSLVSQSGATNSEIVEYAHQVGVGMNLFIATGNEAQTDIAACVDFLVDDEQTSAIMVFAEAIKDTATFASAAHRALAKRKPIVVLKVGTSELTAKVAAAHTGSLVGDDKVFDAAMRQLGVIRVYSIEELVNAAALLAYTGPLEKPGVGIVSISGGACTLFADRGEVHGVSLPEFSEATQQKLRDMLPSLPGTMNPLDITGAAIRDGALFTQSLSILGQDPSLGFIGCIYNAPWNDNFATDHLKAQLKAVGEGLSANPQPGALIVQTGKPFTERSREFLRDSGVPAVFGGIEDLTIALGHATWWSAQVRNAANAPAQVPATVAERPDSERAVLDYLHSRGVPVIPAKIATTREEALAFAASLDAPVALKIASPDIAHKTEVGGVKLNLSGAAVGEAFDAILASVKQAKPEAKIDGILVSPMRGGGLEFLVGTVRDPQWGPVLAVGLGGIWVEVLADTQLRLLPVSTAEAKGMLTSLRAAKLLQGFRGTPAADLDKLAEVIAKIGDAALALGDELETLEVNPLWVNGSSIEALDGLTVWQNGAH